MKRMVRRRCAGTSGPRPPSEELGHAEVPAWWDDGRGRLGRQVHCLRDALAQVAGPVEPLAPVGSQASPQKILAPGTDWRFLSELKKELRK
jgi:hypothetical protein